jgi:pimeloyl-ACP methyl ester carboxylesterase
MDDFKTVDVPTWDNEINIRFIQKGNGPDIVYFHGSGCLVWDDFLDSLSENYKVTAPEFPGTTKGDPYSVKKLDDLHDVVLVYEEAIRKLGLHNPIFIGQSFGGMLAAEIATRYPDLVSKLVLLAPVGLWLDEHPVVNWLEVPAQELPNLLFDNPQSDGAKKMLALPEDPEEFVEQMALNVWSFGCTGKFIWPIPDKGLSKRLHRINSKTLIVWGGKDKLINKAYAYAFENRINNSKVEIVDDSGHIPQVERCEETLRIVNDFLV